MVGISVAALIGFFAIWYGTFPDPGDSKSLMYKLWKAGLYHLDNGHASMGMIQDPNRESIVLGKTETELTARFGRLATADEVMPGLGDYAREREKSGQRVRYIRGTAWLIVFGKNDKAVELRLVKG